MSPQYMYAGYIASFIDDRDPVRSLCPRVDLPGELTSSLTEDMSELQMHVACRVDQTVSIRLLEAA